MNKSVTISLIMILGFIPFAHADVLDYEMFWLGGDKYVIILVDDYEDFPNMCPNGQALCWIQNYHSDFVENIIVIYAQEQIERNSV